MSPHAGKSLTREGALAIYEPELDRIASQERECAQCWHDRCMNATCPVRYLVAHRQSWAASQWSRGRALDKSEHKVDQIFWTNREGSR